jgi:hypothetical protein
MGGSPYKVGGADMRLSLVLVSILSSDVSSDEKKPRLYLGSAVDRYTSSTWMTVELCGDLGAMRNGAVAFIFDPHQHPT